MADKQRMAIMENGVPRFAQNIEKIGGKWIANPTAAQLRSAWFKPYVDEGVPYEIAEGYHWERDGWDAEGDSIIQLYRAVKDVPPPPRRFSTADIIEYLTVKEVWPQVRSWLEDMGIRDMVLATNDFSEDDRYFVSARDALKTELGWTDKDVEDMLEAALI